VHNYPAFFKEMYKDKRRIIMHRLNRIETDLLARVNNVHPKCIDSVSTAKQIIIELSSTVVNDSD
jgi:hypothetical protein